MAIKRGSTVPVFVYLSSSVFLPHSLPPHSYISQISSLGQSLTEARGPTSRIITQTCGITCCLSTRVTWQKASRSSKTSKQIYIYCYNIYIYCYNIYIYCYNIYIYCYTIYILLHVTVIRTGKPGMKDLCMLCHGLDTYICITDKSKDELFHFLLFTGSTLDPISLERP